MNSATKFRYRGPDLFGYRAQRYMLGLALLQSTVCLFGSLFSGLWLLNSVAIIHVPGWVLYTLLSMLVVTVCVLIGMMWKALSGLAHRLGYGRWSQIYWRGLFPTLALWALGIIGTQGWIFLVHGDQMAATFGFAPLPFFVTWSAGLVPSLAFLWISVRKIRNFKHTHEIRRRKITELRQIYGKEALARLELSTNLDAGLIPGNPLAAAQGTMIVGVTSRPWHEPSTFSWIKSLEMHYAEIREEALTLLNGSGHLSQYLDYPGVNVAGWNVFRFTIGGRVIEKNCALCPVTAKILRQIPHYPHFRDAGFFVLDPRVALVPHRDNSNAYLTCHLALIIPSDCGLRVGGEVRQWEEGKCVVFDSSYEHEAWNNSSEPRVILLIDFLHPEITDIEAECLYG